MHRVELKGRTYWLLGSTSNLVPNAPCGVESHRQVKEFQRTERFLMHRVELKVHVHAIDFPTPGLFLMHRVELKEYSFTNSAFSTIGFLMHRVELKELMLV